MNKKTIFRLNATVLPLAVSMLFGAGCANQANQIRPTQQNIAHTLGDNAQCTQELLESPNGAQRFIVEWNDGDREALESEMADGVALVKYTCGGIQVLRSCSIPGDYGYRAGSVKTKSLQITDAASAAANLSSPTPGAAFQAAMDQGKALNLAYVMIGSMTTPVKDVTRDQVERAACKEATHFVYQTQIGAFAIEAGEKGKVSSAAEVFRLGNAEAEMSSERQSRSADGDPASCENASSNKGAPPQGCSAMMRISIIPLVDGKIAATGVASRTEDGKKSQSSSAKPHAPIDTRSCPEGTVFDSDLCVPESQATSYLCDRNDIAGCEKQCKKGSPESCGRMAEAFFEKHNFDNYYLIEKSDEPETFSALKSLKSILPLMIKACDEDEEANACTIAGLILGAQTGDTNEPTAEDQAEDMLELLADGCELGNSIACSFILEALGEEDFEEFGIEGDGEEMEEVMSLGCTSGAAEACMDLGRFFYRGNKYSDDKSLKANIPRSAKYTAKACMSGVSEACFWSALMYATNDTDTCEDLIDTVAPEDDDEVEDYIALYFPTLNGSKRDSEIESFCKRTQSIYNLKQAKELSKRACYLSGGELTTHACEIYDEL